MKKHFYSLFAAAAMMLAVTSCSQEEDFGQQSGGDLTTFSVVLQGAPQSRAAGEGLKVDKLYYEVWSEDGQTAIVEQASVPVSNGTAKVELSLMKNEKYDIIFWAQSSESSIYTLTDGLKNISVNYTGIQGNKEENDAFFNALDNFTADGNATTIELRRPFAQLNIGTSIKDWNKAAELISKNGGAADDHGVDAISVKVKGLANTFNAMTGEASVSEDVEFTSSALFDGNFTTNNTEYKYFAMNYLLVPGDKKPQGTATHQKDPQDETAEAKSNVDIEFTLYNSQDSYTTVNVPNAPIQRNYRTNIIGDFLTGDKTIFEVIVMPGFDDEAYNYSKLALVLANGGEFTMTEDVTLTNTFEPTDDVIINLNGHTLKYEGDNRLIKAKGVTVTLNGDVAGSALVVESNNLDASTTAAYIGTAYTDSKIIINGGTYTTNGCTTFHANDGEIIINGGTFSATEKGYSQQGKYGYKYTLNVQGSNGTIIVKGGTFNNYNPAYSEGENPVANFVANGYSSVDMGNNTWMVIENTGNKATVSTTAANLQTTITNVPDNTPTIIVLKDVYTNGNQVSIPSGKDITIVGAASVPSVKAKSVSADGISFTGQFMVTGNLTLKDITIYTPSITIGTVSQFSKSAIALQNNGNVVCENVTFEMANGVADATAITSWWSTGDGANITVKNCTFNCAGQRPIRSGACVTVENCVFNDPYRYAVQMTSKSSTMDENAKGIVNFYNNIINAGTTSSKTVVYGVQLEGSEYGCYDLTINGAGNVINLGNTGKTGAMYYCECGKVDHNSITWNTEVAPVHEKGYSVKDNTYYIASAEGLVWVAKGVNESNKSFAGKTITLTCDIDLSGIDWKPIGQTGATEFKGNFDGQNYTIKNLNINSESEKGDHYSSALFGWLEGHGDDGDNIIIKNVTIDGANVVGHHNCGALVGYMEGKVVVDNCHVNNAKVTCTNATSEANGDKAGALIGNGNSEAKLNNSSASNSMVSAGRDAGQVVGAAKTVNVTGCSATNVTVSNNGTGTGANIRNEVIGRLL